MQALLEPLGLQLQVQLLKSNLQGVSLAGLLGEGLELYLLWRSHLQA